MVVTFDALNTQEKTITYIKSKKGHYVAPIRDNHKDFLWWTKNIFYDTKFLNKCENEKIS